MLCQYCDGTADGECDWKENGGCKHSPENENRKENEMNKTEIENKIYNLERANENYKNIIKANENEIKKLEAEKEKFAFERVEEVADKINFLLKLERLYDTYCPDYKPDWSDVSNAKWRVAFDHEKKKYVLCWDWVADCKTVYFDSEETAKKVYETLNKEIEK